MNQKKKHWKIAKTNFKNKKQIENNEAIVYSI